ncbi:hypothetical protein QE152_g31490 [Popillia japonica]|uniref:Uncharacterized protein n=1 Tax=Popillia japonica TaxID=7064 RepID=A0AAW1J0X4_POPJA
MALNADAGTLPKGVNWRKKLENGKNKEVKSVMKKKKSLVAKITKAIQKMKTGLVNMRRVSILIGKLKTLTVRVQKRNNRLMALNADAGTLP